MHTQTYAVHGDAQTEIIKVTLPLLFVGEHCFGDGELVGDVGADQILNDSSCYVYVVCGETDCQQHASPPVSCLTNKQQDN